MRNAALATAAAFGLSRTVLLNGVSAFLPLSPPAKPGFCSFVQSWRLYMSTTIVAPSSVPLPAPDENGIYDISNKEEHIRLLEANQDKIVILKFYAPWCRSCKGLEPKFIQIATDPKYERLPLVFAQFNAFRNKDYVQSLGVVALPSIFMYSGSEGLVENFPCGPSKVPILKRKIVQVVNDKVDPETLMLLPVAPPVEEVDLADMKETEPCIERPIVGTGNETQLSVGDVIVSVDTMNYLRTEIPYFKDLTEDEFKGLMEKAKYQTFEAGSVIMKQGMPGRVFYVIDSGEVEISVKSTFEDPLVTPSSYLGAVINRLTKNNYFGERSLITGQPRAASIRASEKTRAFAFDVDDIPESSLLSGKRRVSTERLAEVDDKYGVDFYDTNLIKDQFQSANTMNQARGSFNQPRSIRGVDTDDDVLDDDEPSASTSASTSDFITKAVNGNDEMIISLLVRFKLLRHAARCFEYISQTSPKWGNAGEVSRRSLLVSKLTPSQRAEFKQVFNLIDKSNDGKISITELKNVLDRVGEGYSDEELRDMMNKAGPSVNGNESISLKEFMGIMAEAEFYYLFKETFSTLDKDNTGFVRAGALDAVLCGLRDLVSDDHNSIIDMEDKDMLIDYEQFSKMLIGTHA